MLDALLSQIIPYGELSSGVVYLKLFSMVLLHFLVTSFKEGKYTVVTVSKERL